MSIFSSDIFQSVAGLGALPRGADTLETLARWRGMFPGLPSDERLREQHITHYTTSVISSDVQRFDFYNTAGTKVWVSTQRHRLMTERDAPVPETLTEPLPVRREDDGLLPAPVGSSAGIPTWVPFAVGGTEVLGAIAWFATRRRPVARNRHRRWRR